MEVRRPIMGLQESLRFRTLGGLVYDLFVLLVWFTSARVQDGQLYVLGETAGGNSIFRWDGKYLAEECQFARRDIRTSFKTLHADAQTRRHRIWMHSWPAPNPQPHSCIAFC